MISCKEVKKKLKKNNIDENVKKHIEVCTECRIYQDSLVDDKLKKVGSYIRTKTFREPQEKTINYVMKNISPVKNYSFHDLFNPLLIKRAFQGAFVLIVIILFFTWHSPSESVYVQKKQTDDSILYRAVVLSGEPEILINNNRVDNDNFFEESKIKVKTDNHSRVEIISQNGSSVEVFPNSELAFDNNKINHYSGRAEYNIFSGGPSFVKAADFLDVHIVGTEFYIQLDGDRGFLELKSGILNIETSFARDYLSRGQKVEFSKKDNLLKKIDGFIETEQFEPFKKEYYHKNPLDSLNSLELIEFFEGEEL
ncbi:MAG: hypothetical protein ACQESP_02280 [Candidatus Muiribacteriota bacterium]